MELLGGWDRVRRNLVGTFFLQAKAKLLEDELPQPDVIVLERQTNFLPFAELEREYRELATLDELLQKEREKYAKKQDEFQLRWRLCSEKNDLQKTFFANFENYYTASRLKQKADKKLNEQLDIDLHEKTREVNRLKKQLARMKELKVELEQRLKVTETYRKFMEAAVEESGEEFENVSQVMARYTELKEIRDKYVKKTMTQVETAFQLEKEIQEIVQLKEAESVVCKTYLSQLANYRSDLQISNWRQLDNLIAVKAGLRREIFMTHIPKTAMYNLYLILCEQMKQPAKLQENQFREQLEFIQKFFNELLKTSSRTKEYLDCPSNVPLVSEKSERKRDSKRSRKLKREGGMASEKSKSRIAGKEGSV